MKAYTFRVLNDENTDFLREVQILEDQTFIDFHDFLVDICNFQGNELASFYVCDDLWNKMEEISLIDMSLDEPDKVDDEEENEGLVALPMRIMENTLIADIVKTKHQKLIYEFDFMCPIVLNIECVRIENTDSDDYPLCIKSEGDLEEIIDKQMEDKRFNSFDESNFDEENFHDEDTEDSEDMEDSGDYEDDASYDSFSDGGIDDNY